MLDWLKAKFSKSSAKRAERRFVRSYQAARQTRFTGGFGTSNGSADAELITDLTALRNRSRALVRDSSYAKRAKVLVVNNVIGTGIGLQAQVKSTRGKLNKRVNQDIEDAWTRWMRADSCHTGGRLHFCNFERALMGQVFEAGEVFVRKHIRAFGSSEVPYALELIEPERLADEFMSPTLAAENRVEIRMGVEIDRFYRPVAYWIRTRHPNEVRFTGNSGEVERVPADQIIHLAVVDRWPQTRGEPWLHTAARKLNDMDSYSEAELDRARTQACTVGAIETSEDAESLGEEQEDGSIEMNLEPGTISRLNPGEKLHALAPTSPNPALEPFMRHMLREVAAGAGVSYESLSKDYSQSNYSSSRLALLDDRDLWRVFQLWFIRDFRDVVHREWLQWAVLSGAIEAIAKDEYAVDPAKFEAVRYKPRGWSWIDPTKEVQAYTDAIKSGLTTVTDVIAQTAGGSDIEDVLDARSEELELMRERGLIFETSPEIYTADAKKAAADAKAAGKPPDPPQEEPEEPEKDPPSRVFPFERAKR